MYMYMPDRAGVWKSIILNLTSGGNTTLLCSVIEPSWCQCLAMSWQQQCIITHCHMIPFR